MIENEIAFLRGLSKPYRKLSYGELSEIVNASYAKTNDIRETMKETGVSFDEVWDMTGMKDIFENVWPEENLKLLISAVFKGHSDYPTD